MTTAPPDYSIAVVFRTLDLLEVLAAAGRRALPAAQGVDTPEEAR